MAELINFFFPTDRKNNKKMILVKDVTKEETDYFVPDAVLNITHNYSAEISENPVEDGSKVTDNIVINNKELTIEAVVADQPLEITKSLVNAGVTALAGFLPAALQGSVVGLVRLNQTSTRIADSFKLIEQAFNDKTRFTMVTGLKRYANMVITGLTLNETKIKELRFTMTIKQIKIARAIVIAIPASKVQSDVKTSATSNVTEGKKAPEEPTSEVNNQGRSFLLRLAQSTGAVE